MEASDAPKQAGAPWRPEERKLLGTMPDREVTRATNRTEKAVRRTITPTTAGFGLRRRSSCWAP